MGHEWESITSHRTHGSGCPTCSGKKILIGFNDLATTNPDIAALWHPTSNGDLKPSSITAGSQKKVWWQCSKGHDWQTVTTSLTRGSGCPECASYGFDPGKPAILYFISNPVLASRKIGITNFGTSRLESFSKAGWVRLFSLEFKRGEAAKRVEGALFSWLRGEQGLSVHLGPEEMGRVGGWTETFSTDGPSDLEVVEKIKIESQIEKL